MTFRLTKFNGGGQKRKAINNVSSTLSNSNGNNSTGNKKGTIMKKKRRQKRAFGNNNNNNNDRVPIPSFSPVLSSPSSVQTSFNKKNKTVLSPLSSLLLNGDDDDDDTPVKKKTPPIILKNLWEDDSDDDDDDDDMLPPAAFIGNSSSSKTQSNRKKQQCTSSVSGATNGSDGYGKEKQEIDSNGNSSTIMESSKTTTAINVKCSNETIIEISEKEAKLQKVIEKKSTASISSNINLDIQTTNVESTKGINKSNSYDDTSDLILATLVADDDEECEEEEIVVAEICDDDDDDNKQSNDINFDNRGENTNVNNEQQDQVKTVAAAADTTTSTTTLYPTQNTLLASIDCLFEDYVENHETDFSTLSIRDVVQTLEKELIQGENTKLSKADKSFVKKRLQELMIQLSPSKLSKNHSQQGTNNVTTVSNKSISIGSCNHSDQNLAQVEESKNGNNENENTSATINKEIVDAVKKYGKDKKKKESSLATNDDEFNFLIHQEVAETSKESLVPLNSEHTKAVIDKEAMKNISSSSINDHDKAGFSYVGGNTAVPCNEEYKRPKQQQQPRRRRKGVQNDKGNPSGSASNNVANGNGILASSKPTSSSSKQPAKRKRATTRKRTSCSLCSTCSCQSASIGGSSVDDEVNVVHRLSSMKSNAYVEKRLIRRLQKLEKTTDYYEDLTDQVQRELKKHRRLALKQHEEQEKRLQASSAFNSNNNTSVSSRFLPDADEWDAQIHEYCYEPPIIESEVVHAQSRLFGNSGQNRRENKNRSPKGGEGIYHQPTLTQLMGISSNKREKISEGGGDGSLAVIDETVEDDEASDICPNGNNDEATLEEPETHVDDDSVSHDDPDNGTNNLSGKVQNEENILLDENLIQEDTIEEDNYNHRISYRNDIDSNGSTRVSNGIIRGNGIWATMSSNINNCCSTSSSVMVGTKQAVLSSKAATTSNDQHLQSLSRYKCAWDQLFDKTVTSNKNENSEDNQDGLDYLLKMLENPCIDFESEDEASSHQSHASAEEVTLESSTSSPKRLVHETMLTPNRRRIAENIESKILCKAEENDGCTTKSSTLGARRNDLDDTCPNWKENIRFALYQTNEDDVKIALDNLQKEKLQFEITKEKVLQCIHNQELKYEVYETSMRESLAYLKKKGSSPRGTTS